MFQPYSDSGYSHLSEWEQYRNNAKFLESENHNYENIHYEGIGHMGLCDLSLSSPLLANLIDQAQAGSEAERTAAKTECRLLGVSAKSIIRKRMTKSGKSEFTKVSYGE